MKILVTGSRGTLGTPLCAELARRGHEVWGCDLQHHQGERYLRADVSSFRQLERTLEHIGPDVVYHLAAEFGRLNGEEFYDTLWSTNVIGTKNILELQKLNRFKLVFASSSEIYGECPESILSEDLSEKLPLRQLNEYAISKYVSEQQILNAAERYGTESVICRFFNSYGPGEHYHPYRSVVCLFCHHALNGLPWTVYEGYNRVFMYITDFIPTLATVCERYRAGEIYNIGGAEYRSVRELSDLILELTDARQDLVTSMPEDHHNVVSKRPDISKAKRDLDHDPRVTLEEGVPETLEWMAQYCHPHLRM